MYPLIDPPLVALLLPQPDPQPDSLWPLQQRPPLQPLPHQLLHPLVATRHVPRLRLVARRVLPPANCELVTGNSRRSRVEAKSLDGATLRAIAATLFGVTVSP